MVTMLDYINEEEETLLKILENHTLRINENLAKIEHLMILATGSSYNACLSAKMFLEKYGDLVVTIEEPYNFNHYGRLASSVDAVVAVSQSGKSASTIDAIAKIKKQNLFHMALTSDLNSPISKVVDQTIDLQMGIEKVGFVTKGFVSTVLQMMLLGVTIGFNKQKLSEKEVDEVKEQLKRVIQQIPEVIDKSRNFFNNHQPIFKLSQRFIAIGYGPAWGTAKEFETKFTETVRQPSHGFELEAYMHGPYLEADTQHLLFFIENESINSKRSEALRSYMSTYVGDVFTITTKKAEANNTLGLEINCPEWIAPLVLIIPFQIFAFQTALSKGIDLNVRIFDDFDTVLKSKI